MPGPLNRRARTIEEAGINMAAVIAGAPQVHFRPLVPQPGDV